MSDTGVDPERIEKIRKPGFDSAALGYNRRQVDQFLAALADWLEGADAPDERTAAFKAEIDRINEQTSGVLAAAGTAAAELRSSAEREAAEAVEEAEREAGEKRATADGYSESTRSEADGYAEKARGDADAYSESARSEADGFASQRRTEAESEAGRIVADAQTQADQMLADGRAQVSDLEIEITELRERRNVLLDDLEHLASTLTGTASLHRDTQAMDVLAEPEAKDGDDHADRAEADEGAGDEEPFFDEPEEEPERESRSQAPRYVEDDAAEHRVQGFDPLEEDGIGGFGSESETTTMPLPPRRPRDPDSSDPEDEPR